MLKEDYVSFEVAKLLKEKGFDEECFALYNPDGMLIQSGIRLNNIQVGRVEGSYSAPTLQMAMKWLREKYGISIEISALNRYRWVYTIYRLFEERVVEVWNDGTYVSYEDAIDDALKYCLENLNKLI